MGRDIPQSPEDELTSKLTALFHRIQDKLKKDHPEKDEISFEEFVTQLSIDDKMTSKLMEQIILETLHKARKQTDSSARVSSSRSVSNASTALPPLQPLRIGTQISEMRYRREAQANGSNDEGFSPSSRSILPWLIAVLSQPQEGDN
eukprot:TRINITY_DN982_c0_g1_i1.p2 TRINITY_DN982_c0_g1~~TRINITY_DN982_c0_g1_i1.p2  ORF type:complete len:147 (-),score=38.45 TRINITY_DN982_c0_g1_i1:154-594(-)